MKLPLIFPTLFFCAMTAHAQSQVTVAAGDFDRLGTVVAFPFTGQATALRTADGTLLPLQIADGTAFFTLPSLPKNQTQTFTIINANPATAKVSALRDGAVVRFSVDGKKVFDYQAEPGPLPRADIKPAYIRGGYIHPLLTPSGRQVTDDFPSNHIHHHGIWFPWTKTEFEGRKPDFWNMGQGTGRVEFVELDGIASGAVFAEIKTRHRFVDLQTKQPTNALNETWSVKLFNTGGKFWLFDLESHQQCAGENELKLPKYHYGGLGLRGNWAWNGKGKVDFLTSEKISGAAVNETRGNWCYMGGQVDGAQAGMVVLCHPKNFRAPQPFRAHPEEPFLCLAPSQLGDWAIKPGQDYVSRYRFIAWDGAPDAATFDRLSNDYSNPPQVTVSTQP